MRSGVEIRFAPGDRERLEAVVASRNSLQKHVWRARIVLLSGDGIGTMEIQLLFGTAEGPRGLFLHQRLVMPIGAGTPRRFTVFT